MRDDSRSTGSIAVNMHGDEAFTALRDLVAGMARMTVSRAAAMARAGDLSGAEELLSLAADRGEETAAMRDLLAKVCAQQGRLLDAERHWRRALDLDPGHASSRAGLVKLSHLQRRVWIHPGWLPVSAAALVVMLFSWLFLNGLGRDTRRVELDAALARLDSTQTRLTQVVEGLDTRLAAGEITLADLPRALAGAPPADLDLAVPGVALHTDGRDLVVTFTEGLFGDGDRLLPQARDLLTLLGRRLAAKAEGLQVQVVGHTDDIAVPVDSGFQDNFVLSERRAQVVARRLSREGGLPYGKITCLGQADLGAPYPNDSWENRRRNRTVVLLLRRTSSFAGDGS